MALGGGFKRGWVCPSSSPHPFPVASGAGIGLPGLQAAFGAAVLAAAGSGKLVVLLIVSSFPVSFDSLAGPAPAIVLAYTPAFGAPAVAAALFGENRWGRATLSVYPEVRWNTWQDGMGEGRIKGSRRQRRHPSVHLPTNTHTPGLHVHDRLGRLRHGRLGDVPRPLVPLLRRLIGAAARPFRPGAGGRGDLAM